MKTICLPVNYESVQRAASILTAGSLVAFPTETVYGLGGNALLREAVTAIYRVKRRPADNPMIVHIAYVDEAKRLCHWSETASLLASAFWPGPMTMLLPKKDIIPDETTAGLPTVALRIPDHPAALRLIAACGFPLAGPSANLSGRPSPTSAAHVLRDFDGLIPMVLDGGACAIGVESTVIDVTSTVPRVLRPGAVTPEQISMVCGHCQVDATVMRPLVQGEKAASPGMRHQHYAPKARLTLVRGEPYAVAEKIKAAYDAAPSPRILAFSDHISLYGNRLTEDLGTDASSAAHRLYYLLRSMDDQAVSHIFSETLPETGLGLAVMNRLARASGFDIIDV